MQRILEDKTAGLPKVDAFVMPGFFYKQTDEEYW